MASIELPLPHDPADYEPKAVAGKFSYRAFATIVAVVASEIPLILRLVSLGMDELPNTNVIVILAAIPAALIALIGLSRREGLYFESWFPPLVRELMTPTTILPAEALPTSQEAPKASKEDARAMRAESPVLQRDASALATMAASGHVVRGVRLPREPQERPRVVAVAPELVTRGRMTFLGIKPRKARKLVRRGVTLIPTDPARSAEVSAHRWVGRRLAQAACRSAAEVAGLIEPFDVQSMEDVLFVLAAHGIEARPEQLEVLWPSTAKEGGQVERAYTVANEGSETPSRRETTEDAEPGQRKAGESEGATRAAEATKRIAVDVIFGAPDERSMLSRKAYKALVKAGVSEVEVDPAFTTDELQARYGIRPRAAQELRDAMVRLSEEEPIRQENE